MKNAREDTDSSNVVQFTASNSTATEVEPPQAGKRKAFRWRNFAAAAAMLVMVVAIGWMVQRSWMGPHLRTQIGEQRSVALDDGSLVFLNTDSELFVELSRKERRIMLTRGEARFTVAKDPKRPFYVSTKHATVRALGTIFNVQTGQERTAVSVIEGHIEVTGQADLLSDWARDGNALSRVILHTGQQAAITMRGEILRNSGPPLERVMGWPDRRLVFRDETLIDLVTEFNRYHRQPIRIADPRLAGHRINGTFDAFDRTSLLQYLQRYEGVNVKSASDGSQLLLRAEPARRTQPRS